MECNRDEAIRARDIAEKKYAVQDFVGAKKFVLKAQRLFPDLDGISQMLAVLDVHHVAQTKVSSNEMDWYGILQVEPVAADSIIKRQYRKLALLLHPDKNNAVGAEAAFKLVSEAFGVLSDKDKRAAHDVRRRLKAEVWQAHTHVSSQAKAHATQTSEACAGGPQAATGGMPANHSLTFWTACPECHMQYQYLRTYLNFQVQCQKCHKSFEAKEIGTGQQKAKWRQSTLHEFSGKGQAAPFPPPRQQDRNGSVNTRGNWAKGNGFADGGVEQGHSSSMPSSAAFASKVAETVSVVQETYLKVRRTRVEAEKEAKRKEKEKEREKKEILRQEKQKQKKLREELRAQEALDRMKVKQQEATDKGAKGKTSERNGNGSHSHKQKRKDGEEVEEDYDSEEDEDQEDSSFSSGGTKSVKIPSGFSAPRRSLRTKRNVTYCVDDSDNEELPRSKRSKLDAKAEETVNEYAPNPDLGINGRMEKGKYVGNDDWEDNRDASKFIGEIFKSNGHESGWQGSFQVQSEEKCKVNDSVNEESSEMAAARETQRRSSVEDLEEKFRRELNASFRVSGVGAKGVKESGKWAGGITVKERLADELPGRQ